MGLRDRIKEKLKARLQDIRALVNVIHDEAKHPGRPQPHMAARNPLYGGEERVPAQESDSDNQSTSPDTTKAAQNTPEPKQDSDDFWYLRGDDEGWSNLNPGKQEDT